jgi:hypothetical protein
MKLVAASAIDLPSLEMNCPVGPVPNALEVQAAQVTMAMGARKS